LEFKNEPLTDFSVAANRAAFQEAIQRVNNSAGAKIPLIIGSEKIFPERWMKRENPSHPEQRVGLVARAEPAHAERALAESEKAWPGWSGLGAARRAQILQRAAEQVRRRRFELAAWEVLEVGKPWIEADADVAEAVDFLMYYSGEMLRLEGLGEVRQLPGERNFYRRQPLGPGAVIAPWNFPLAILTGMTAAALAAGNTVLLKPAEQSSVVAFHLARILLEAGLPPGVLQFLPGPGEEIGESLVRSPRTRWIAFTGSRKVGLKIVRLAAEVPAAQPHVKRVIAEMGGKNAILVDDDADLDEAVLGVAASAFGYSGQKCSACSRVIVLQTVMEKFLGRLVETIRSLPVGPAEDPATVIGPLVDGAAQERVLRFIENGKKESKVLCEGIVPKNLKGYFVPPVLFSGVRPESSLAQEEIFGPVLSVLSAGSFDEALRIANGVPYALTGGLYSRSPRHIEQAMREFHVGNLYINRKITGAAVGRQPFGGFKLSGTGTKAGGPDTLLQFLQAQTITENTARHGFAPLEE